MQCDKVGALEQSLHGRYLGCGTHAHEVDDIVVDDLHSHGLGQDGQLVADVSVSDDSKSLATYFPAACGNLVPDALVQLHASVTKLSRQRNDFRDDEFGNRARVGERRVEDGDTCVGGILEVDLVGTNTEATDDNEVLGLPQNASSELSLGTNTDDVDISERSNG